MWGRKRWFLSPPEAIPTFNPNRTTLQWLLEDSHNVPPPEQMVECTLNPGEVSHGTVRSVLVRERLVVLLWDLLLSGRGYLRWYKKIN